jgi:hypothetical protein
MLICAFICGIFCGLFIILPTTMGKIIPLRSTHRIKAAGHTSHMCAYMWCILWFIYFLPTTMEEEAHPSVHHRQSSRAHTHMCALICGILWFILLVYPIVMEEEVIPTAFTIGEGTPTLCALICGILWFIYYFTQSHGGRSHPHCVHHRMLYTHMLICGIFVVYILLLHHNGEEVIPPRSPIDSSRPYVLIVDAFVVSFIILPTTMEEEVIPLRSP